jgi:subtilisin
VIAVSSTTRNDGLSSFSSTGSKVDLAAPGSGIYSTYTGGGYETLSGTSMACPHVAGAAGQLMANGYSNTEARDQMNSTAEDIGLPSNEQGNGLLDVEAAVSDGSSDSSPTVDGLSASEVETSDGDAEFDVSWGVSDTDGDLASVDLTLTDDTDGTTEDTASVEVSGSSASGTTKLVAAGDDGSGNGYTVDVTVTDSYGNTGSDSTAVSETEDTNTAPTIDSFGVSTRTSGPWFRVESDWSVSDPDGDLDSVTTELLDSDDNVIATSSSDVSGSSASGTQEVRTRSNASDSVRLTVTDVAGNSTSETRGV